MQRHLCTAVLSCFVESIAFIPTRTDTVNELFDAAVA